MSLSVLRSAGSKTSLKMSFDVVDKVWKWAFAILYLFHNFMHNRCGMGAGRWDNFYSGIPSSGQGAHMRKPQTMYVYFPTCRFGLGLRAKHFLMLFTICKKPCSSLTFTMSQSCHFHSSHFSYYYCHQKWILITLNSYKYILCTLLYSLKLGSRAKTEIWISRFCPTSPPKLVTSTWIKIGMWILGEKLVWLWFWWMNGIRVD